MMREQAYTKFYNAIMNNSLQELTDAAYELLGYPVLVNDELSYNLAHTPMEKIGDDDYDLIVDQKVSTQEHFLKFYRKYISNSENKEFPILICDGEKSKTEQLFSVIRFHGNIMGYTSFILNKPCTEEEKEIVRLFNGAARSIIVAYKEREHMKEERSNHMLNYLLTSQYADSEDYINNAYTLGIRYQPPYAILRVKCSEPGLEDTYTSSLFTIMRKRLANLLYTDLDKSIYYLVSNYSQKIVADVLAELENVIGEYPVHISMSLPFENLKDAQGFYQQARLTMKLGTKLQPQKFAYKAIDYLPLQLYAEFAEHNSIVPYLSPMLTRIIEYDRVNHTEYFQTLWIYLYCFLNIKESAERLHIHTNTMHYRISRLEEIFGIDFRDYYLLNLLISNIGLVYVSKDVEANYMQVSYQKEHVETDNI